jgi:hypothetical protein
MNHACISYEYIHIPLSLTLSHKGRGDFTINGMVTGEGTLDQRVSLDATIFAPCPFDSAQGKLLTLDLSFSPTTPTFS